MKYSQSQVDSLVPRFTGVSGMMLNSILLKMASPLKEISLITRVSSNPSPSFFNSTFTWLPPPVTTVPKFTLEGLTTRKAVSITCSVAAQVLLASFASHTSSSSSTEMIREYPPGVVAAGITRLSSRSVLPGLMVVVVSPTTISQASSWAS